MVLPEPFVRNMRLLLGDDADGVLRALDEEPVVSVRANRCKPVGTLSGDRVPWASDACFLPQREAFTFDPLFHAGCYYVQEASSMFLEQAVRQYLPSPVVALDLCAAPGGKSTLLRSVLPEGSLLVSNEIIPTRARVLCENMTKWGHPDSVVTSNAPVDFAACEGCFDLLVCDVPCSGEGMFRKDSVAVAEWSEENVAGCVARGREILQSCWPTLRPGGLLAYSTCTFNLDENERQVEYIARTLGADVLPLDIHASWGITGNLLPSSPSLPCYRFIPGRTRGEGFFLALLRKQMPHSNPPQRGGSSLPLRGSWRSPSLRGSRREPCSLWLTDPDAFEWSSDGTTVSALPLLHAPFIAWLRSRLHLLQAGVTVAEQKGRDIVPSPALALSIALRRDAFPQVPLSWSQAIAYLRREAIALPSDTPRGIVLLTYRDIPLGFARHVGNRANNLYPMEWRIRTTHLPDSEPGVLK
jgi:16S rRNA C967 or C1407 C5-methylase (RsmB/RsmF family)/NOL1/NOP2/fmu family ribosome biogenesis protein